jgi:hypothetical protein
MPETPRYTADVIADATGVGRDVPQALVQPIFSRYTNRTSKLICSESCPMRSEPRDSEEAKARVGDSDHDETVNASCCAREQTFWTYFSQWDNLKVLLGCALAWCECRMWLPTTYQRVLLSARRT